MEKFTDNTAESRFELAFDGGTAIADYQRDGNTVTINRVFVPEELRGQGAAGKIMTEIARTAEKDGLTLVPVCSYAVAWMEKNAQKPPRKNGHTPR